MKVSFISTRRTRHFFLIIRYFTVLISSCFCNLFFRHPQLNYMKIGLLLALLVLSFLYIHHPYFASFYFTSLYFQNDLVWGQQEIFLLVDSENIAAQRLYEKSGNIVFVRRISISCITVLLSIGQCDCF